MALPKVVVIYFFAIIIVSNEQLIAPKSEDSCSRIITEETAGVISSPGFPEKNYQAEQNCSYMIVAPSNYVIEYFSTHMDLEGRDDQSELCVYDRVSIYDGNTLSKSYCGNEVIFPNASTSNTLRIEFVSDFTTELEGFQIKWSWLDLDQRRVELHCNFDDSIPLCAGWTNQNSEYQWLFGREHTPSPNTGPVSDHTTGNARGRYAYIEGSKTDRNSTAELQSPAVLSNQDTNMRCVRFWYHMFGNGIGDLSVFLSGSDNRRSLLVAQYSGDKGDKWWEGNVTITLTSLVSTIIFKGRRGSNYMSDIAVDDIEITVGSCDGEGVGFALGRPGLGRPSMGGSLPGSIIPTTCAGNLEKYHCPGGCDLSCDNFLSSFPEVCTRACIGNCACPSATPILHEMSCINFLSCPNIDFGDVTTTFESAPGNDYATAQKASTEGGKTTLSSRDEEKKEKINGKLINLLVSALLSILPDRNNN